MEIIYPTFFPVCLHNIRIHHSTFCMKSTILTTLFIVLLSFSSRSQTETETDRAIGIKWAPAGIAFGKITLGGEYNLTSKSAATLTIGIPFNKTLTRDFDGDEESLVQKTFSIMGGYRLYLGDGDGAGLYFEPYLKYLKHEASATVDAEIDGTTRDFLLTTDYNGFGVGAQLGSQFLIGKKFIIDLYFLGPEANISKANVLMQELGNNLPWSPLAANDAENEIRDIIEDIPIIKNKAEVNVNAAAKNVTAKYNGFLPGFRFGVSFGFRF